MVNQEFRRLLQSEGTNPTQFEIPQMVRDYGAQRELERFSLKYEFGLSSSVVVYDDKVSLEQALSEIRSTMGSMFRCVDFSYNDTIGKPRIYTDRISCLKDDTNPLTTGLLSHLFSAKKTEYTEKTLVLYHSFDGLMNGMVKSLKKEEIDEKDMMEIMEVGKYLDGGCGRSWTHAHSYMDSPRLPKLIGASPLICTALVMSLDEKIANNLRITSCSRSKIGTSFSVGCYIF